MAEIDPVFLKLDQIITLSRLNSLASIATADRAARLARMMASLGRLRPGAYLLGTGPSTVGITPLTMDEIVLGRMATPAEEPSDAVVDVIAADTLYFCPQEVSRVHAKVVRKMPQSDFEYWLIDVGSTCGTFINDKPVDQEGSRLFHGDVVSLGPSRISTYIFFVMAKG